MSTCEAEYVAAATTAKEVVWQRQLLQELNLGDISPTIIYSDSQSAIKVMKNPMVNQRTKAMDIQNHYVKELILDNVVDFQFIPNEDQLADHFAKFLGRDVTESLLKKVGVYSIPKEYLLTTVRQKSTPDQLEERIVRLTESYVDGEAGKEVHVGSGAKHEVHVDNERS